VCGHADEHCPVLPASTTKEHWPLDDPAKAQGSEEEVMNQFRTSRDNIERRVKDLLARLSDNSANIREITKHRINHVCSM
jgi:arsenate reductase